MPFPINSSDNQGPQGRPHPNRRMEAAIPGAPGSSTGSCPPPWSPASARPRSRPSRRAGRSPRRRLSCGTEAGGEAVGRRCSEHTGGAGRGCPRCGASQLLSGHRAPARRLLEKAASTSGSGAPTAGTTARPMPRSCRLGDNVRPSQQPQQEFVQLPKLQRLRKPLGSHPGSNLRATSPTREESPLGGRASCCTCWPLATHRAAGLWWLPCLHPIRPPKRLQPTENSRRQPAAVHLFLLLPQPR